LRNQKNIKVVPAKSELLLAYHNLQKKHKIKTTPWLEKLLVKRAVRTLSGVSIITVLTKAFPCPGKCLYCPEEKNMPKSYLADEPAAARALSLKFNPYKQVTTRLVALKNNGHPTDKIELIVKGGTWNAYDLKYQYWFITMCFIGANNSKTKLKTTDGWDKIKKTLTKEQKKNETAKHRIIGLTLETRPDQINIKTIQEMRELGCTRVEIGVQTIDEDILRLVHRGHGVKEIIDATKLLKQYGFKVDYHLMPQLPGSTSAKDIKMMREIFSNPDFRPDMIKIYPCTVVKNSPLFKMFQQGKYKPYSDKKLIAVIKTIKQIVPGYVRISRLIRDIPGGHIQAGNKVTNLRQLIQTQMKAEGLFCKCLRCREAGHQIEISNKIPRLFIEKYDSSGGKEYFISFENKEQNTVFAFCRLRIDREGYFPAFVRELHTYGQLVKIGKADKTARQHQGLGTRLMAEAEKICQKEQVEKLAVISGVGVRGYYKKMGYRLKKGYMVKTLSS
jgi:elongator complex protein 3